MDVVVTHPTADFDGLASAVACRRLYPGSVVALVGTPAPSARAFLGLHADELEVVDAARVDLGTVTRVVACEVGSLDRLGPFEALVSDGRAQLVQLDHHERGRSPEQRALEVSSTDGALTTTLVFMLAERGIEPTAAEATLFALGIHEDTGSLTFATTTERDAEALAWCLRHGARQDALGRYLRPPLGDAERDLLDALLRSLEPAPGAPDVRLAIATAPGYLESVSTLADRLVELVDCDALVCVVEMGGRTVCVARSRGGRLDAAALARDLGGGGHPQAAAATLHLGLDEARRAVLDALPAALLPRPSAADLMSSPPRFVAAEATVSHALAVCQRHGQSAILLGGPGDLLGVVTREDLDRALAHGLSRAPVKAVAGPPRATAQVDTPLESLETAVSRAPGGYVPVLDGQTVVGVVTRRDVLGARGEAPAGGIDRPTVDLGDRLLALPGLAEVFEAAQAAAAGYAGVYLVGGAVRDLLLGSEAIDLDLAVEGDGIAFAGSLARVLRGRVVPHEAFGTAVVVHATGRLDVATARTEYYEAPAALPAVERATIRQDLLRRDYTINAMALALHGDRFGQLVDPFGGRADLEAGALRVLHNLSFVDDPTRIFRGVRYEARYGFRMDGHTESLARACVEMGLVGAVSPARVRDELVPILEEASAVRAIARLGALGLGPVLHPHLAADEETAALVERLDALRAEHAPRVPAWRPRLAALARGLSAAEVVDWLARLRLRRRDADRVADAVVAAPRLLALLETADEPAAVAAALSPHDPDGVLLALALAPAGRARAWLERYLDDLREIELEVSGRDIAALGLGESPRVGEVLGELRRRKLNGELAGRDEELAAARGLIRAAR